MTAQSNPYVSLVVTGRNDGYGGDFVSRFLATLQFNHRELSARGIDHEVVLVEWAPIAGAPLLADVVEERCPPAVAASLRTVVVDASYQDALTLNPRLKYQEFIAKNVGVRHARGTYVITTNCDIFLGRHILQRLGGRELQPDVVYRAPRYDLKEDADYERMEWGYLEDRANLAVEPKELRPPHFGRGSGDFIAVDRAAFERVGGFNEIYRLARIGIDRNFLVQALASGLTIVDIGGPVYHVSHEGSFRDRNEQSGDGDWAARFGGRWHASSVGYRNAAGWGLANAPRSVLGPRRTRLEFSWDAVPPLVNLGGIVPLDGRQ